MSEAFIIGIDLAKRVTALMPQVKFYTVES